MTDIIPPPFSVVVQEIDALGNTETQHGHLMALMRHRAMLAAAPQPPVVEQPQGEQQTRYLAGGARYKVTHLAFAGYCIHGLPREMLGQWVAFVDATDNKHMDSRQPQSVTYCHQSQPQGEQEPVAYYVMNGAALFQLFRSKSQADALAYDLQKRHDLSGSLAHFHVVPLYTHQQPKREPLTDEQQIAEALRRHGLVLVKTANGYDVLKLGQITAHGIGGAA